MVGYRQERHLLTGVLYLLRSVLKRSYVFLFRRDSSVPLRNSLLLSHDRGLVFGENGAFHADLPPTAGEWGVSQVSSQRSSHILIICNKS